MHPISNQGTRHQPHKADETTEPDPLTTAPRWALCPLDWHAHAVDPYADHPLGLWIARCGHRLSGGTPLYDFPQGHRCPSCAKWSRMSESSGQSSGEQP